MDPRFYPPDVLRDFFIQMQVAFSEQNHTIAYLFQKMYIEHTAVLEDNKNCIRILMNEITSLKTRVNILEKKNEENNPPGVKDQLVFSGPEIPNVCSEKDDPDENFSAIIDLVRKVGVAVQPEDISVCRRLGRPPTTTGKPDQRPLMVMFCRRDLKYDIMRACRDKHKNFFVNEYLSPTRNVIACVLRRIKKSNEDLIKGIFTVNGRVFIVVKPESSSDRTVKIPMDTKEQLEQFCRSTVGKPLELLNLEYSISWPFQWY